MISLTRPRGPACASPLLSRGSSRKLGNANKSERAVNGHMDEHRHPSSQLWGPTRGGPRAVCRILAVWALAHKSAPCHLALGPERRWSLKQAFGT